MKKFSGNILQKSIINQCADSISRYEFIKKAMEYINQVAPMLVKHTHRDGSGIAGITILEPSGENKGLVIDVLIRRNKISKQREEQVRRMRANGFGYIHVRNFIAFKLALAEYFRHTNIKIKVFSS